MATAGNLGAWPTSRVRLLAPVECHEGDVLRVGIDHATGGDITTRALVLQRADGTIAALDFEELPR